MPNPDPGFPLPLIVDPPRICIQIEIPNERYHIAAFLGNFVNLGYWFNWQRDADHTGLAVSKIWYEIFLQVAKQISLGGNCAIPDLGFAGADDGSEFMIRQNPTNPCLLESSVNGTDWCVFADISKCMNFGSQPGVGNKPPTPGGGTQQTCTKLNANGTLLLPLLVSTGDQITLDSVNGAAWDGVESDFGPLWRFANGDQFIGGVDVGFPTTKPGDPLPSVNHMKIIAGYGAGPSYLDLSVGTPVTIPSGVSNAQIWVQVNDDDLSNNQGSFDVCATVKNNQTLDWIQVFDFTKNPYSEFFSLPDIGGFLNGPLGVYVPGVGYKAAFQTDTTGKSYFGIYLRLDAIVDYTEARSDFTYTAGSYASAFPNKSFEYNYYPGPTSHNTVLLPAVPDSPQIDPIPITSTNLDTQILTGMRDDGANPGGDAVFEKLTISGKGTNPFA